MSRYTIGAAEVAVNPTNAEQVAPAGTLSPADAASKEALKNAKVASGVSVSPSTIVVGLFVVGLGVVAYREAKAKKKSSG